MGLWDKVRKVEPGISLAQLLYSIGQNLGAITSYASGGALMGTLAYLQQLPPLTWGAAIFGGLILVAIVRAINGVSEKRRAEARLLDASAKTSNDFNRLETQFVKQQIRVADLIHPLGTPITDKVFIDCDFLGPGLIVLSGSNFDGQSGGGNVELIRLKSDRGTSWPNKAILMKCHLKSCRFYNVALAMTSQSVDELTDLTKKSGGAPPIVLGE